MVGRLLNGVKAHNGKRQEVTLPQGVRRFIRRAPESILANVATDIRAALLVIRSTKHRPRL